MSNKDIKSTRKTIKLLNGSTENSCVSSLVVGGKVIDDPSELAEEFNIHFSQIADKLREKSPDLNSDLSRLTNFVKSRKYHDVVFTLRDITISQVIIFWRELFQTNQLVSTVIAPVIAPSIVRMINYSFATGTFPQRWKTAKVTPLFKKGDGSDPSNYRPISVLTVLSKVIERYVHDSLYDFPQVNNLIYSTQSGFCKHHGTETAMIKIADELLLNLDNNRVSGVLLLDYCKAFEMVDHNLLLMKLEAYGVTDRAYNCCQSYLSGRRLLVCIDGKNSSLACVNHGVPQGSILGPPFFILFINDLPLNITAQTDLYADDTTITCSADYKFMHKL